MRARPLVAFVASAAACGSPTQPTNASAEVVLADAPAPPASPSGAAPVGPMQAAALAAPVEPVAQPRVMPSGRPACGNVASRAASKPCDPE